MYAYYQEALFMIARKKGLLVSIEGIDGSGKSTLAASLVSALSSYGLPVLLTKEPGATELGTILRALVQKKEMPICSKAEYLLFAADRAQHFEQVIMPALEKGKIIISDRMADSSLVYQGYGRGLEKNMITDINRWTMNGITPDITIYVKVSAQTAFKRIIKRNAEFTSFEKEQTDFIERLITGFDEVLGTRSNTVWCNGEETPEYISNQATQSILSWITNQQQA